MDLRNMHKMITENPETYYLERHEVGTNGEYEKCNTDEPYDVIKYNYRLRKKKREKDTRPEIKLSIWTNQFGHVYINKEFYNLLRADKRLYIKGNADLAYYDMLDGKREQLASFKGEIDFEEQDLNSLRYIAKFLGSIASGIRRPSDAMAAKEMQTYLTNVIKSYE